MSLNMADPPGRKQSIAVAGEGRLKTGSRIFPPFCVGGQLLNVREKKCRRWRMQEDWSLLEERFEFLRTVIGVLFSPHHDCKKKKKCGDIFSKTG